jgi:hypothetical protein
MPTKKAETGSLQKRLLKIIFRIGREKDRIYLFKSRSVYDSIYIENIIFYFENDNPIF